MPKSDAGLIAPDKRETVEKAVKSAVESISGFELVELKTYKEYGKHTLEAFIWSKDGVSLDDCERVHNALSEKLDELDELFLSEYVLNVSSQGLDRPIVTNDDFRRALGTEIEIISESGKTHGLLQSWDEEKIVIERGGKPLGLIRKNISKVQPYVRF